VTEWTDTVSDPQPSGGDTLPSDEEPEGDGKRLTRSDEELEDADGARDLPAPDGGH